MAPDRTAAEALGLPKTARPTAAGSTAHATASDAAWVTVVRRAALVVFPALIVFSAIVPARAGRVFWTVTIAALPLFFVLAGYHRWRRICPLAAASQLPAALGFGGNRRAGRWLQAHAYHVAFGVFLTSLWLRLVATNGDGHAIALFLFGIAAAAFVTGAIFTGKTWCNFVCPISFVEKIYTEPRNLRDTPNSQCRKCSACKPACPDINEENSYWKEIQSAPKRHVYFAFPGVVLAFYVYYYLQAGTWEYYFGGRWTNQVGLFHGAFRPGVDAATAGFFFWPAAPRAVAAAATLLAGALVSFAVFSLLERPLGRALARIRRPVDGPALRHVMLTVAAFAAFVTFYTFAGAPTLRLVPGLTRAFQIIVVTSATLFLVRRLARRQEAFAEEALARQVVAKWPWSDAPPRSLREAFLVHTVRSQSQDEARQKAVELYKSAVRDLVGSGIVSRADVHRLESIRSQMRIGEADHERVMAELAEEDRGRVKSLIVSPEKHLQLETYAEALAVHLGRGTAGDAAVRALRDEFAVTEAEHAVVLDRLVRRDDAVAATVVDAPATIERALEAARALESVRLPVARFLDGLLRRRAARAVDRLLETAGSGTDGATDIRRGFLSLEPSERDAALASLGAHLSPAVAERLSAAQRSARNEKGGAPGPASALRAQLDCPDAYIRAAALQTLSNLAAASDADRTRLNQDEHPIVREVAAAVAAGATDTPGRPEQTTLDKMVALTSVGLFDGLEPEELARLARSGRDSVFGRGEALCRQGEVGDEVFVMLEGEVAVTRRDGEAERVIAAVGPGGVIGELAVLDPAPRDATVVASSTTVRTLRVSGAAFRSAVGASPAVAEVIMRLLARRVRAAAGPREAAGERRTEETRR